MSAIHAQTTAVAVGECAASPGLSDRDRARDDSPIVHRGASADPACHRTGRRKFTGPTACEPDHTAAVDEFQHAMEKYKQQSGRKFPTWSEVLEVLVSVGYQKVAGETGPRSARSESSVDQRCVFRGKKDRMT
jgi:hypothetical protein